MPVAATKTKPATPVAPANWPGSELGLPATGEGSLATSGERIGARVVDGLLYLVLVMPLIALESAIRAATPIGEAPEAGDGLSSVISWAMLAIALLYDPVTTRLLGATPGKRLRGLAVVRDRTAEPAGPFVLAGRTAIQFVLWAFAFFPGWLNMKQLRENPARQGWHDQALGTVVVRTSKSHATVAPPAPPLAEPWRSIVDDARGAEQRFVAAMQATPKGPIRDRVSDLRREVERTLTQCERAARSGAAAAELASGVDVAEVEARAAAARDVADNAPDDFDALDLADALESEATSGRRMHRQVLTTERRVRKLVAQLGDVANRAAEVAMDRNNPAGVDHLIDELTALSEGLAEVAEAAGRSRR